MDFNAMTSQELIDAILAANANSDTQNTIYLTADTTYSFSSAYSGGNNALPVVTKNLTIIGDNTTLERNSTAAFRFFKVGGGVHFTLIGLDLNNGLIDQNEPGWLHPAGGAIICNPGSDNSPSDLTLIDCHFKSNQALDESDFGEGGAVLFSSDYDTAFEPGKHPGCLTVLGCSFAENTAANGSAIYSYIGDIQVWLTAFKDNTSTVWGGAVSLYHYKANIEYCHFQRNSAVIGGGLSSSGGSFQYPVYLNKTVFEDNSGQQGGAVYFETGKMKLTDCTFNRNQSLNQGGAIHCVNEPVEMTGCIFDFNKTTGSKNGQGGAIYTDILKARKCHFYNNQAAYTGDETIPDPARPGVVIHCSDLTSINHCYFQNNTHQKNSINVYVIGHNQLEYPPLDCRYNDWGNDNVPPFPVRTNPHLGVSSPSENEGSGQCMARNALDDRTTDNPISLRQLEKRINETDIELRTPNGPLTLERMYRQSKQNTFDFMGAGWGHNHHAYLIEDTGVSPAKIELHQINSKLIFYYDSGNDVYVGASGGTAVITKDNSDPQKPVYKLTMTDKTIQRFNVLVDGGTTAWLKQMTYPNGNSLTYTYDINQKLIEITDGYGRSLKFAYYASGDFKNGLLKRVGTHTSSDLENSPAAPFVEYVYTDDGNGVALLTDVQDVRGETWLYEYDTQASDQDLKNNLIRRQSPLLNGSRLTLEQLTYQVNGNPNLIRQERGNGLLTNEVEYSATSTTERLAGRSTIHHFDNNDIYQGTENPANEQTGHSVASNYQTVAQEDANNNSTYLKWNVDGTHLEGVEDAEGNQTNFVYDSEDRLIQSEDSEGRITTYIYEEDGREVKPRNPAQIIVADSPVNDLVINGGMENNSDWVALGSPTTSIQSAAEVSDGEYAWQVSANQDDGIQSNAAISFAANKTYLITARVFVDGAGEIVQLGIEGSTDWDVLSGEQGQWETLRAVYTPTAAISGALQFRASSAVATWYVDSVHVLEVEGIQRWQQFVYDSKGRTLEEHQLDPDTGYMLQSTVRTYGTSGNENGLLHTITEKKVDDSDIDEVTTTYTYDAKGRVVKTGKTSLTGTCQYNYTLYDPAGNVRGTACTLVNVTPPVTLTQLTDLYDAQDNKRKHTTLTLHTYDEMGRRYQTTQRAERPDEQTSYTVYDALDRVICAVNNYKETNAAGTSYTAPDTWTWDVTNRVWTDGNGLTIEHGADNDENIIQTTRYNARGLAYFRRDVLGRVTLTGYDEADRAVKTVQFVSQPDYDASYITGDPDLSAYPATSNPGQDIITEQVYDAAGNVILRQDASGSRHVTVYDALNRPIRQIQHINDSATIALNPGDAGYDPTRDPRTSAYIIDSAPDRDQITTTEYDAMGRVIRTRNLLENRGNSDEWDVTLYGYNASGQQVRTIRHASVPDGEYLKDLSDYPVDDAPDVDHVTRTVYDAQGRVKETIDVDGRVTRMVYDGLGRQTKMIQNFVSQATDPVNWVWSDTNNRWELDKTGSTAVEHGDNSDQNIITRTIYDSDGRVLETRRVDGLVTRRAYDDAGRQAATVQNYIEQGSTLPDNWVWQNTRWEDGSGNAVDRGTHYDQNLISRQSYDNRERVQQTRDAQGNLTYHVYTDSGRQVMTIRNYVEQTDGGSNVVTPDNWVWQNNQWELNTDGTPVDHGTENDQNLISATTYDLLGRVIETRNASGQVTHQVYDNAGRQGLTVQNYVPQNNTDPADWIWQNERWEDGDGNAINHGSAFDQNLITRTIYNQAGQVIANRDARGTLTGFAYDAAGWRVQTIQADGTPLTVTHYTCYDKAGRQLRQIRNYVPVVVDGLELNPDEWNSNGDWKMAPDDHGMEQDTSIITEYIYDRASRRVQTIQPTGAITQTAYLKNGQVDYVTDPEGIVTVYRYDEQRRRVLVVQNYVEQLDSNNQPTDPADWFWDGQYQVSETDTKQIEYGANQDQNIIVQAEFDLSGHRTLIRDPRGNATTESYDARGRRIRRTNPLNITWQTAYSEVNQAQQVVQTYPGINGGGSYDVTRGYDKAGRVNSIAYNAPTTTPNVSFVHSVAGNRLAMVETDGTTDIRRTDYTYDAANRLTEVAFDADADATPDDIVQYSYDKAGRRTQLTINPAGENLSLSYEYDDRGRLVQMIDYDNHVTQFSYDALGRHIATQHPNGVISHYSYDTGSRLKRLLHQDNSDTLIDIAYEVDARGNRTRALELLREAGASVQTQTVSHDDADVFYRGNWTENAGSGCHETTDWNASLELKFAGDTAVQLTMGEGPDYSMYDVYINDTLWQSIDGYAVSSGQRVIDIPLDNDGWNTLSIHNRHDNNLASSGYRLQFYTLSVDTTLTTQDIRYTYDALSRLLESDYNNGAIVYTYGYDPAGNLVNSNGTTRTYNELNQMISHGSNTYQYDANGNLTTSGYLSYEWDEANRLLQTVDMQSETISYQYDGQGNRLSQAFGALWRVTPFNTISYLNDIQPGLTKLLRQSDNQRTTHFVHGPRGIQRKRDDTGTWLTYMQDGLGSVRGLVDNAVQVQSSMSYDPYGQPMGSHDAEFGFTGEQTDPNGQIYLRARYYDPALRTFTSLDPFEGVAQRPMSLNGYSWVEGNPVMNTDPSGKVICSDAYNNNIRDFERCLSQMRNLRNVYNIRLRSETENGIDDWTTTRVANIANAVSQVSRQLGNTTSQAIGNLEFVLVPENTDGLGAAVAANCRTVILFLNFTNFNGSRVTNHDHTTSNIIHELGHILTLSVPTGRTVNSESFGESEQMQNRPVALWDQITVNRTIFTNDGWNTDFRESSEEIPAEIVADMFLYWVTGIGFDNDGSTGTGAVRRAFANGGEIPASEGRPQPLKRIDDTEFISAGFVGWARQATCPQSLSAGDATYETVIVDIVNSGWCLKV